MNAPKNFFKNILMWTALVGFVWIVYTLIAPIFIKSVFEGRSLGFLNNIIAGQEVHPLSFYVTKADSLMKSYLGGIFFIGCLVIGFVCLGNALTKKIGFLFLCTFLLAEFAVRIIGFKAWNPADAELPLVEPGGRVAGLHPTLGYAMLPGLYTITFPSGPKVTQTNGDDFLRITRPLGSNPEQPYKGEIWIFGCSFTYGWALNDEETYPWLLQEKFPNYNVINFGTVGYGTLHSFIQFEEALKTGRRPVLAIYTYASFHDSRNTFLRSRGKSVRAGSRIGPFRQPYARIQDGRLHYFMSSDTTYKEFPLMRFSALIHLIEECYNKFEDRVINSHEVTKRILIEFYGAAKAEGVPFVVAGIDLDSKQMLSFLRTQGISTVDIAVDSQNPIYRDEIRAGHPGVLANQEYAATLAAYLRKLLHVKTP